MTDIEAIAAIREVIEKVAAHEQKHVLRYVMDTIDARVMVEHERAMVEHLKDQAKQAGAAERSARRNGLSGRIS